MTFAWRFEDPSDTYAVGTYMFPVNPNAMDSPFADLAVDASEPAIGGDQDGPIPVLTPGEKQPATLTISGVILSQDHLEALARWYFRRAQVLVTDHFGRQMLVIISAYQPEPVRSRNPWKHHFTMKMVVLREPETVLVAGDPYMVDAPYVEPPPYVPPPGDGIGAVSMFRQTARLQASGTGGTDATSGGGGGGGGGGTGGTGGGTYAGARLNWFGLSCSRHGQHAADSVKQADTMAVVSAMATQYGISSTQMRAHVMYHGYIQGTNWNARNIGPVMFAKNNGFMGVMQNSHVPDLATWANGGYDTAFQGYLQSFQALGMKTIIVIEHEPENNGWNSAQAALWCKGTARFMKMTYEFNDPDIYYSTCYIPNPPGLPRSAWNPHPALTTLVGSTQAQKIMDRTLCGTDPYPEVNKQYYVQTLADRCGDAIKEYRTWGFTRFSFPEVAFFNYKVDGSGTGGLTAAQQAARLHSQLAVWAPANGVESWMYFDQSDPTVPRSQSRTIDTPQEQLEFAKLCMGDYL